MLYPIWKSMSYLYPVKSMLPHRSYSYIFKIIWPWIWHLYSDYKFLMCLYMNPNSNQDPLTTFKSRSASASFESTVHGAGAWRRCVEGAHRGGAWQRCVASARGSGASRRCVAAVLRGGRSSYDSMARGHRSKRLRQKKPHPSPRSRTNSGNQEASH